MAEIKVRITGDNADLKKKMEESSAESRLMAAEMREQFSDLRERAADIAGEAGLGKIGNLLKDLSGGAVLAFGTAIIGTFVEGAKKASEFGDAIARIGIQLGNPQAGRELGEYIEKLALAHPGGPSKDSLLTAAQSMLGAGMKEEEIRSWIPRIQNLAAGTGMAGADLGEMVAGGSVGITRGLEHSPLVRGAMQSSGIKDPSKALAWVADTLYSSAASVMDVQPSGQLEGAKRGAANVIEQMMISFMDPQSAGYGDETVKKRLGIYPAGINPTNLPTGPAAGIFPAGSDLREAAADLKAATKENHEMWRKFGDMWNVQ